MGSAGSGPAPTAEANDSLAMDPNYQYAGVWTIRSAGPGRNGPWVRHRSHGMTAVDIASARMGARSRRRLTRPTRARVAWILSVERRD